MSLLGKILLFFNFVLAVVVLLLAGQDYGKRTAWRYALRKHQLVVMGLPVTGAEVDTKNPGDEPIVADVTDGMLKEIFANAQGGEFQGAPVKTVKDELDRVHVVVKGKLTSKAEAKRLLVPTARTLGERQELIALIDKDDEAGGMPAAKAELDRRKSEAERTAETPANYKNLRYKIGQFLVSLNFPDEAWRARCTVVLGLEAYDEVLNRQAEALAAMGADLERAMLADRATFERQHLELVQSILKESDELYAAKVYLADLKKTAAERQTQVAQRQTEKEEAQNKLAQARLDADTAIARLKAVQADLFALQMRKGAAMQANQQLEAELRQLEQKR